MKKNRILIVIDFVVIIIYPEQTLHTQDIYPALKTNHTHSLDM